jgi:hypothetical protein
MHSLFRDFRINPPFNAAFMAAFFCLSFQFLVGAKRIPLICRASATLLPPITVTRTFPLLQNYQIAGNLHSDVFQTHSMSCLQGMHWVGLNLHNNQ